MSSERKEAGPPTFFIVEGLRMPNVFSEQLVKEALSYKPHPGDIFVVTYPKCGTTWVQYIAWCLFNLDKVQAGHRVPTMNDMITKKVPFLERVGTGPVASLPEPRLMKHHFPFFKSPYHPEARYVVVVRNPFDCAVSLFYHRKNYAKRTGLPPDYDFDAFFEDFLTGDLPYGSYFDHVLSWYPRRRDNNVLLLCYEELQRDTPGDVLKIADFLDPPLAKLRSDPGLLARVIEAISFRNLKANACEETTPELEGHDYTWFFQKGIVGDWKSHFSHEQKERLMKLYQERMAGTDFCTVWEDCLT